MADYSQYMSSGIYNLSKGPKSLYSGKGDAQLLTVVLPVPQTDVDDEWGGTMRIAMERLTDFISTLQEEVEDPHSSNTGLVYQMSKLIGTSTAAPAAAALIDLSVPSITLGTSISINGSTGNIIAGDTLLNTTRLLIANAFEAKWISSSNFRLSYNTSSILVDFLIPPTSVVPQYKVTVGGILYTLDGTGLRISGGPSDIFLDSITGNINTFGAVNFTTTGNINSGTGGNLNLTSGTAGSIALLAPSGHISLTTSTASTNITLNAAQAVIIAGTSAVSISSSGIIALTCPSISITGNLSLPIGNIIQLDSFAEIKALSGPNRLGVVSTEELWVQATKLLKLVSITDDVNISCGLSKAINLTATNGTITLTATGGNVTINATSMNINLSGSALSADFGLGWAMSASMSGTFNAPSINLNGSSNINLTSPTVNLNGNAQMLAGSYMYFGSYGQIRQYSSAGIELLEMASISGGRLRLVSSENVNINASGEISFLAGGSGSGGVTIASSGGSNIALNSGTAGDITLTTTNTHSILITTGIISLTGNFTIATGKSITWPNTTIMENTGDLSISCGQNLGISAGLGNLVLSGGTSIQLVAIPTTTGAGMKTLYIDPVTDIVYRLV